jgi:hypothetical protein
MDGPSWACARKAKMIQKKFLRFSFFRQEQKALCLRTLSHWRRRLLARAFNTWHASLQSKYCREEAMRRAVRRWSNSEVAAAFDKWREAAAGARDKKELAAECVERWRLWRVWGAWEVWREVVERRKEDKAAMQQVSLNPVSSEQSFRYFLSWSWKNVNASCWTVLTNGCFVTRNLGRCASCPHL